MVDYRDDYYILPPWNTFSNTGNTTTLHQLYTITHTHWLPTVADPHHLPGLVAFILAGSTHTTYCKTFQNALGMKVVNSNSKLYSVIKAMVDEICEVAKREMKEKSDGEWKRAVTTADGTWQTRGWHSKNATFTIRNGAPLPEGQG